ncbi:acetyltransferase [Domibacillus sp. DTU_2020_1001157_1_SI_ALB_TIR_016]|uniref:acetyltransferase n=1 Tax=Domibacillus sp. DTU_2020_1001157_1_SI_ALB_TIR_016 TaxID=3077789 RepID=UPI0028EE3451|nr:acetyltransferase [Domibacillus sp. DTU_2020_1001157_1_SI_ALB_TIR_016]WNS81383.1 acetyltransferase [Domibacillus sp. DTU_2020_1001157_1_SI_ALB_TIR_016]
MVKQCEVIGVKKIIIIGSGGHASVIIDAIEKERKYAIYGIIDTVRPVNTSIYGYRIVGTEPTLLKLGKQVCGGIVAIEDNWTRKKTVETIRKLVPDFSFVSIIHPSACISSNVKIGDGTVVMAGAVINRNTIIGEHSIINTNSSVDHDCILSDFVSIAPGAVLGRNVKAGNSAVVSLGAKVIHSVSIGEHTVIGAGSTVLQSIGPYGVAYGTPAKVVRTRKQEDSYLS